MSLDALFYTGGKAFHRPAHEVAVQEQEQGTHLCEPVIQKFNLQGRGWTTLIDEMVHIYRLFLACYRIYSAEDAPATEKFLLTH